MSNKMDGHGGRRWWPIGGAIVGVAALAWIFWRIDYETFLKVIKNADVVALLMVPIAIALEQLVRAWKWRQLMTPIRKVSTLRLFGTIMAGYLANAIAPLGLSPFVRSWLAARLENLKMSTVLATVAIDRIVDGIVFAVLGVAILAVAVFPGQTGALHQALLLGAAGSLLFFLGLTVVLFRYRKKIGALPAPLLRWIDHLPAGFADRVKKTAVTFSEGIVWPKETWRGITIVAASVLIKLIAATHFLWAGLAIGVVLRPVDYVFLIVFLGFLIVLSRFARIPAGFVIGSVFALELLGVAKEPAAAMTLIVQISSLLTVATFGAAALWWSGVKLADIQPGAKNTDGEA